MWVYSNQSLANYVDGAKKEIIGIQKNDLVLKKIEKKRCNQIIIDNHYSHKTATDAHTLLYLGIFYKNEIVGAMQYGYAMNPKSCANIVEDTKIDEYYELNRLWIADGVPIKNVESQIIGMSFKLIKKINPKIKWIQSFADGRVGVGTIYQATNFIYCGSHKTKFVELNNGEVHHEGKFRNLQKSFGRKFHGLDKDKKFKHKIYDQYRYIYFIKKDERKKLLLKPESYPKLKEEV